MPIIKPYKKYPTNWEVWTKQPVPPKESLPDTTEEPPILLIKRRISWWRKIERFLKGY